jgi:hypothetical protein
MLYCRSEFIYYLSAEHTPNIYIIVTNVFANSHSFFEYKIESCDAKNSETKNTRSVLLLSQGLESDANARPRCWLFPSKPAVGNTFIAEGRIGSSYRFRGPQKVISWTVNETVFV